MLDPSDPYSEMFQISNTGYIPVTDLDCKCAFTATFLPNGPRFNETAAIFTNFADYLDHGGYITAPCFRTIQLANMRPKEGAALEVTVSYALYHINLRWLRRSQTFRFKSVTGADRSQHWQFLG